MKDEKGSMKKYCYLFLIIILSVNAAFSQNPGTLIELNKFDKALFTSLLITEINKARDSLHLPKITADSTLEQAAQNQVDYILQHESVTHTQQNSELKTLENRVHFFKGTHDKVGEIIDLVMVDKPASIYKTKEYIKVKSYEQAAYYFTKNALNTASNNAIITNPAFYLMGVGVAINAGRKAIYLTEVLGTLPFQFPPSLYSKINKKIYFSSKNNNIENAYGLSMAAGKECYKINKYLEETEDESSKNVVIENGKAYLYISDLAKFKDAFDESSQIAVDIISRSQLKCEEGNRLHKSWAYDGILLPPVDVKTVLKRNVNNDSTLSTFLGDVPPELVDQEIFGNILFIKDNAICAYYYPTPAIENAPGLLPNELFYDTISPSALQKRKHFSFALPIEQDKLYFTQKEIKAQLDTIDFRRFSIKSAEITMLNPVFYHEKNLTSKPKIAENFLRLMQTFQKDSIVPNFKNDINWDQFFKDVSGSPFSKLKLVDSCYILDELPVDSNFYTVQTKLSPAKLLHVKLTIADNNVLTKNSRDLIFNFKNAVVRDDIQLASSIQAAIFEAIKNKDSVSLDSLVLPKTPLYAQLINNELVYRHAISPRPDLLKELEETSMLDPKNPYINYNILQLSLAKWQQDSAFVDQPEYLIKRIRQLYTSKIEKKLITRLYLNYYMLAARYYNQVAKNKQAEEATATVKKHYRSVDLTENDVLNITDFFISQRRYDFAEDAVLPYLKKGNYHEDMLFKALAIAIKQREDLEKKDFVVYINKARDANPTRFCELFGKEKQVTSLLRNDRLKRMYCETCNKK